MALEGRGDREWQSRGEKNAWVHYNGGMEKSMVIITFPDKEMQQEALGLLVGRYSGTALKSGEHIVPAEALKALAEQNFVFTVQGTADEKQVAALRSAAAASVQRRQPRATI